MSLENAIEFMLYTNFGIDFNDGKTDTILNAAIDKAYNDATMQGAYNALKKENTEQIDIRVIKNYFNEQLVILFDKNLNYNDWHSDMCNYLVEAFTGVVLEKHQDQNAFTYGNAQKWVNMTMKYLYILSEVFHNYNEKCEFDKYYETIQNMYKDFQVPVDSYIIESLWNESKIALPIATKKDFRKEEYKDSRTIPWSKWDDTDYKNFHDTFIKTKEDVAPLEWEHKAWIKIAKQRKEKTK